MSVSGVPAHPTSATGKPKKVNINRPPILAVSTVYTQTNHYGYGQDPLCFRGQPAELMTFWYRPPGAAGVEAVGGYITVKNVTLNTQFNDGKLHCGVNIPDVITALTARIDMATRMIQKGDNESPTSLKPKIASLTRSVRQLNARLAAGVARIELARAWTERRKDGRRLTRLDINRKYFDDFFPESAFPIGNIDWNAVEDLAPGWQATWLPRPWVSRDDLVLDLFPSGVWKPLYRAGSPARRLDSDVHPNLLITLNAVNRMIVAPASVNWAQWPTVEDMTAELTGALQTNTTGPDATAARLAAEREAERLRNRAMEAKEQGDSSQAQKFENGIPPIIAEMIVNAVNDLTQVLSTLESIPSNDPDFERFADGTVELAEDHYRLTGHDDLTRKAFGILGKKFDERVGAELTTLQSTTSPPVYQLLEMTDAVIRELESSKRFGAEDQTNSARAFKVIGEVIERRLEAIPVEQPWDADGFAALRANAMTFRGWAEVPDSVRRRALERNESAMIAEHTRASGLSDPLRRMIMLHATLAGGPLPSRLANDLAVNEFYLEQLKARDPARRVRAEAPPFNPAGAISATS